MPVFLPNGQCNQEHKYISTSHQNHLGALTSQFEMREIILKECKGYLVLMYKEDSHLPQWMSPSCFGYIEPCLLTTEGRPIALLAAPGPRDIPDLTGLPQVVHIFFQILLDPSQAFGKCKVHIETFKVAIMVLPVLCRNSWIPLIQDLMELLHVKDVLEAISAVTRPPPLIGVLTQPRGQLWVNLIKIKLDREISDTTYDVSLRSLVFVSRKLSLARSRTCPQCRRNWKNSPNNNNTTPSPDAPKS
jgi:hypothetical protein